MALGLPQWLSGKKSACSAGDLVDEGSIPGLGRWVNLLEEGMATHSNILAWRILMDRKPGGIWSIGSQRVRNK